MRRIIYECVCYHRIIYHHFNNFIINFIVLIPTAQFIAVFYVFPFILTVPQIVMFLTRPQNEQEINSCVVTKTIPLSCVFLGIIFMIFPPFFAAIAHVKHLHNKLIKRLRSFFGPLLQLACLLKLFIYMRNTCFLR